MLKFLFKTVLFNVTLTQRNGTAGNSNFQTPMKLNNRLWIKLLQHNPELRVANVSRIFSFNCY